MCQDTHRVLRKSLTNIQLQAPVVQVREEKKYDLIQKVLTTLQLLDSTGDWIWGLFNPRSDNRYSYPIYCSLTFGNMLNLEIVFSLHFNRSWKEIQFHFCGTNSRGRSLVWKPFFSTKFFSLISLMSFPLYRYSLALAHGNAKLWGGTSDVRLYIDGRLIAKAPLKVYT